MKSVFFLMPDDLHAAWKIKLAKIGESGKTVFLTFARSFVKEEQHGEKGKGRNKQDRKKAKK